MSNINLVSFLDAAQRTIIAENLGEVGSGDRLSLKVKNPVVVNIIPQYDDKGQPNGQMALQLLPVYFREFQGEKKNPTFFTYPLSQIVMIDFEGGFDFRLYGQYEHIFSGSGAAKAQSNTATTPVLKLFDNE